MDPLGVVDVMDPMGKALCLPLLTTLIILGEPRKKKNSYFPLNPGWLIGSLITGLFESLYTWVVFHPYLYIYIYKYIYIYT